MTRRTTEGASLTRNPLGRRKIITGLSSAVVGFLAGCSGDQGKSDTEPGDENSPSTDEYGDGNELSQVMKNIQQVHERVEDLPVSEHGEFVFDFEKSQEEFDYETLNRESVEALQATERINEGEISVEKKEHLTRAARIGFLLTDQRRLLDRTIVGGLMFRDAFHREKYESGTDVMNETRSQLENLEANRTKVEGLLEAYERSELNIVTIRSDTFRSDLNVLGEVLRWATPVFEGFKSSAQGMVAVSEGNLALENERYGQARERYLRASEHFGDTRRAFDTAHGRGQPLDYVKPLVNELRCFIPTLQTGYADLEDAFSEFEAGNEEEGRRIARRVLGEMDEEFQGCI